jgi:hypothetical protein
MVNKSELRIGNKLSYGTGETIIVTVESIGIDGINHKEVFDEDYPAHDPYTDKYNYEDLNPIKLTPEILEQCGFELGVSNLRGADDEKINTYSLQLYNDQFLEFSVEICSNGEPLNEWYIVNAFAMVGVHVIGIKYLHQLMNLYHSITGEELTFQPIKELS